LLLIDGCASFIVTADDADRLEQQSVEAAAQAAADALTMAIAATREGRSLDAVLRSALTTAAATAVLALLLLYEWLSLALAQFPYTRVWGQHLNGFLLGVVVGIARAVIGAVPGLVTAAVIYLAARFVSSLLDTFFERVKTGQLPLSWLDADVADPTRRIVKVMLWLFALAMAYPYLPGSGTDAFKGLSLLVGLMISIGSSNLAGQLGSGLILTYARVFRRGEYVRIGEHEGTVIELGMFATRIRTGLGEELTLSNSLVLGAVTKN